MNRVNELINTSWAWDRGLFGRGVCIAVVDTGLYVHDDFDNERIMGFSDFVNFSKIDKPYDDNGHGTHVSGIIAGSGKTSNGRYMGVAPKSNIYSVKALDSNGNGKMAVVIRAIDWLIKNAVRMNIRIVNISIGTTIKVKNDDQALLVRRVEQLWDTGVTVCVAAGNNGPGRTTVSMPGVSPKVITVGFIPRHGHYSGQGPTRNCIVKPEIMAPGENIVSCGTGRNIYVSKSGTSMATPIVSGAVALLLEKYPSMTNKEVKMRLYERVIDLNLPKNIQGWGYLDIARLLC